MTGTSTRDGAALEALVAQVADEFLERQKRGERPDIEEYAARHAEVADLLRKVLAALQLLGASGDAGLVGDAEGKGPAGTLGDFRILREVGRGGMGIVYEAEQISLGRRVALKVLPFAATMDPRQLQRFQNEARAAASLHHEHIAPVHGVGSERGVHYYAMQFIDGQTLAALIARQRDGAEPGDAGPYDPTLRARPIVLAAAETVTATTKTPTPGPERGVAYYQTAARLGVQAAEALEHAHRLGIVHRDVKPGNLMVDGQGKLWVTDFGLARVGTDPGLTMTGDLLGTLRYMAPEQALAKHGLVDHRTDVYSLGVTLYELVTLQPAIDGKDKEEVLRKIAFDEPTPSRRVNPAVPAELETVLQKAMAKELGERYATAQELADDLRNWLEDKPIRARRPTLMQRTRKWSRRHQPAVWAAAVVALVVAGSLGWASRDRAARQAEVEHQRVEREAETNREVDRALQEAAFLRDRGDWPKAKAAVQRAEWLLGGGGSDANRRRVRVMAGDLHMVLLLAEIRLGEPQTDLSSPLVLSRRELDSLYAEAFKDYGVDIAALDAHTAAERIRASAIRAPLVAALDDWMWAKMSRVMRFQLPEPGPRFVKPREVRADYQHLCAVADLVAPDELSQRIRDPEVQKHRKALEELADRPEVADLSPSAAMHLARLLLANALKHKALALLYAIHARSPDDFLVNQELARVLGWFSQDRLDEAIGFMRAAIASRPQFAVLHLRLGEMQTKAGRFDQAITAYRKAFEVQPNHDYTYNHLALALEQHGKWDEALDVYSRYAASNPDKSAAYAGLGRAYLRRRLWDKARTAFEEASRLVPNNAAYHNQIAWLLATCPDHELRDATQAVDWARKAVQINAKPWSNWRTLGVALYRARDWQGAVAALEQANPPNQDNGPASDVCFFLAMAQWRLGEEERARQWYERGVQRMNEQKKAMDRYPDKKEELDRFRAEASELIVGAEEGRRVAEAAKLSKRAEAEARRWDKVIAECSKEIELRPDDADARHRRAIAYTHRGQHDTALSDFAELVKCQPDSLETHFDYAAALLLAGDFEGYKRFCAQMLGRRDKLTSRDQPGRRSYLLARICVLAPDAVADPARPALWAEDAAFADPKRVYILHTLGLAHYRDGRHIEAVKRIEESLRAKPKWSGQHVNRLTLAMAHYRMGNTVQARQWFDKAVRAMDQHLEETSDAAPTRSNIHPHDRLAGLLLRREAEALMNETKK